jgi:DNA-directed RNA polymerase specialized sigma24 family protein
VPNHHAFAAPAGRNLVAVDLSSPLDHASDRPGGSWHHPAGQDRVEPTIDDLLLRMRAGDREAAGAFVMRYGARIRRRVRGKLGPSMRRLFDSLDILSTLGRRLDVYVMDGRMQAADEMQLWNLVFGIADHALVDKARIYRRLLAIEGEDSEFAHQLSVRLRQAEDEDAEGVELEIEKCLLALKEPDDRRMLSLWLTGESLSSIADLFSILPATARKRWEKIKATLRDRLQPAGF